jgi:catechol 2,3-dioxygenase-like lactoylglutathione lyase family enzyme
MPYDLKKLTPNLIVSDVARSVSFYTAVLGFEMRQSVPDEAPYVFASIASGNVEIFLNAVDAAAAEYPELANRPIGGTLTLFIEVVDIKKAYAELEPRVPIVLPLEHKWYGVTEFAFTDPDGYVITFAERDPEP